MKKFIQSINNRKLFSKALIVLILCIPLHTYSADETPKNDEAVEQIITDQSITAELNKIYAAIPDLNFFGIRVTTIDGVVHLKATVTRYKQRYRAIEIAKGVNGVKDVDATELYYFDK